MVAPGIGLDSNGKWEGALYSTTEPLYDFGVLLQGPAQIGYCHVYHLLRIIDYSGLASSNIFFQQVGRLLISTGK